MVRVGAAGGEVVAAEAIMAVGGIEAAVMAAAVVAGVYIITDPASSGLLARPQFAARVDFGGRAGRPAGCDALMVQVGFAVA